MAFGRSVRVCAAVAAGFASLFVLHGQDKPKVNYEAPEAAQRTDLPQWPYTPPPAAGAPHEVDDGQPKHLPGSKAAFTLKEIDGQTAVDWFPDSHPAAPDSVTKGRPGQYRACATCHLMNGYGKSDTANLNGLSVAYMLQQIDDMKNDQRHAAVRNMSIVSMLPVAKGVPSEDAKQATEYFHSIPASKNWVKLVEATTVPVTIPAPHRMLAVDPSGKTEPIGNRIIEIPVSFERTALRDPSSPFIAYVPVGSIKKGQALAKNLGCATCHGADLRGMGDTFPPLAGRSPSAMGRQLYDFKSGARNGKNAMLMKPVVAKMSDEDIVNLSAYLASLTQ